jgi:hypothetical protein
MSPRVLLFLGLTLVALGLASVTLIMFLPTPTTRSRLWVPASVALAVLGAIVIFAAFLRA